ncbi:hypothetical protein CMV_017970 [Castanea mollissima]|uniref:Uncharacterized protein n=1 Tax=Castanea mollissima TaxID=60419 RepID=A0A8J4R453_9ROSI|nr:hypothetical protein CMV_017970 [Castanea mollissima]
MFNNSTTPSLSQNWRIELGNHGIGISSFYSYFSTDSRSGREGAAAVSASMGGRSKLEEKLQTSQLPEMVFGGSCLILKHVDSGTKIHFNAFDALTGWKQEGLCPVKVPAAAKWKFRR